jgi:bifunctional ADP-heptose synthase (sugar kinase/adenylyltransferase)
LLAAFQFVDLVVIFGEPTPLELIRVLEPDVLVKGGDWPVDTIVGREIVSARGGTVLSISLLPGLSTTSIEQKIIEVASESTGK